MSINTVTISGNLTRDSELREAPDGTPVVGFRVAVTNRRRNGKTGRWENHPPDLVSCAAFGGRAVALSKQLVKRTGVTVSGRLRYSRWEVDGKARSNLSVVAEEVEIIASPAPRAEARKPGRGNILENQQGASGPDGLSEEAQNADTRDAANPTMELDPWSEGGWRFVDASPEPAL